MDSLSTVVLENNNGMRVEIINYGARIASIKLPVEGQLTEMLATYDTAEQFINDPYYLGATCGRVCNRITQGLFELDDKQYQLPINNGENCLHGGVDNFSYRYWHINKANVNAEHEGTNKNEVTLSLVSEAGDQGFPGKLLIEVQYTLSADNALHIKYSGQADAATPINLTNHAYFNLGEQSAEQLTVQLNASHYLEKNEHDVPTGSIISVEQSDFDFRTAQQVGLKQKQTQNEQLLIGNGYDHCFVLDDVDNNVPNAVITSHKNNVCMKLYTDQPAVQFYTGYYLNQPLHSYQGLCLEAQNYTDAVNHSHFPDSILRPNHKYQKSIAYQFEVLD